MRKPKADQPTDCGTPPKVNEGLGSATVDAAVASGA